MNVVKPVLNEHEYVAVHDGTAILTRTDASPLSVRGADRADFLHRMTTNDINALRPGQSAVTVLTTPTARIQFVFTVACRDDDLLILPAQGESQTLSNYLRSQIFFMDQVEIEPVDAGRLRIVGAEAATALEALGYHSGEAADGAWWDTNGVLILQQDGYDIPGYEVVAPPELDSGLTADLERGGAIHLTDTVTYDVHRVELGRPAPRHELTEAYNPLEVGMAWACSDRKGCYTGQEIIARQITYDKVTKSLVGLICEDAVTGGDTVIVDGRSAGMVTSAAYSPSMERHIALAVVQRPHNTLGTRVVVQQNDDAGVGASVTELPLSVSSRH